MHNAQCTIIGAIGYWRLNVYNLFVYLSKILNYNYFFHCQLLL